jgi:hypothetical protein
MAVSAGGGVYVHTGSVTIADSTISNNQVSVFSNSDALANVSGGGLYVYSGTATISNSIITGNLISADTCGTTAANAYGGGVYTHTGDVTINDTTISGNITAATRVFTALQVPLLSAAARLKMIHPLVLVAA